MMRVPNRYRQLMKVQFLPIIVDRVIVMIAVNRLIIDGESVMLNRRTTQASTVAGVNPGIKSAFLGQSDAKTVAAVYPSSVFAKILALNEHRSLNLGNYQVS